MSSTSDRWQPLLAERAAARAVPGAVFGLLAEDRVTLAASGVVNRATGVETTTDALFQIGSISKVHTATVLLRLVEAGLLSLDAPVRELLPRFAVADAEVSRRVTLRHLLTHTSGIGGDLLISAGEGDDALERYVARCAELPQDAPFGALFSYCNAGPVIAARMAELATGATWDEVLRDWLLAPAGLEATVTLPSDALRFRAALGHVGPDNEPSRVWGVGRALGPSGGICATAADLLAFARVHLDEGLAARTGERLLSAETAIAMRTPQVDTRGLSVAALAWGFGWALGDWDGRRVCSHDGTTIGQHAFLRVVPEERVALVLLTNGGDAVGLAQDLIAPALAETCGLAVPAPPAPSAAAALPPREQLERLTGVYDRYGERLHVTLAGDGRLRGRAEPTGVLAELDEQTGEDGGRAFAIEPLDPASGSWLAAGGEGGGDWSPLRFLTLDGERWAHLAGRAARRVG